MLFFSYGYQKTDVAQKMDSGNGSEFSLNPRSDCGKFVYLISYQLREHRNNHFIELQLYKSLPALYPILFSFPYHPFKDRKKLCLIHNRKQNQREQFTMLLFGVICYSSSQFFCFFYILFLIFSHSHNTTYCILKTLEKVSYIYLCRYRCVCVPLCVRTIIYYFSIIRMAGHI